MQGYVWVSPRRSLFLSMAWMCVKRHKKSQRYSVSLQS